MAFKRVVTLEVINNNTTLTQISNLDIEFDIERSITLTDNTAEFVIHNAKTETRNNILKAGNNIIFKAGYEDEKNIASIFFGTIDTAISVKDGVNWITTISAKDAGNNKQPLTHQTLAYSYIPGSPVSQVISDLKTFLNIPVFGLENIASLKLNNGLNYSGALGGLLRQLQQILNNSGIGLFFDSSQMVIFNNAGRDSKFGVVNLTQNSGLIGNVEDVTDTTKDSKKRIKFKSLMNPKFQPLGLVNITGQTITGLFIIEKLVFSGDNFGGDFSVSGEGVE